VNEYSEKGRATVEVLKLDEREALENAYLKTYRRLRSVLHRFPEAGLSTATELAAELRKADDHGLLGWWLTDTGVQDEPLREFRRRQPAVWEECVALLQPA
jgi:hypothetical protein